MYTSMSNAIILPVSETRFSILDCRGATHGILCRSSTIDSRLSQPCSWHPFFYSQISIFGFKLVPSRGRGGAICYQKENPESSHIFILSSSSSSSSLSFSSLRSSSISPKQGEVLWRRIVVRDQLCLPTAGRGVRPCWCSEWRCGKEDGGGSSYSRRVCARPPVVS